MSLENIKRKEISTEVDKWLARTDGEFIIYALNKKDKEFVVINDILGRLPLYYYYDDAKVIISRELSLVTHLIWRDDDGDSEHQEQISI